MNASVARYAASASLFTLASALRVAAAFVHARARRLDAWLALRDRAAVDQRILQAMSARERRDIGLPPDPGPAATHRLWTRDTFV